MTRAIRPLLLAPLIVVITACTVFSNDSNQRTPGIIIDDNVLGNLVEKDIRASDPGYEASHLVIVAYNGLVLIAGQVPSSELKEKATAVAQGFRRARVHNHLSVGPPTAMLARTNDALLTSKIKSRLLANDEVSGLKIKVQTENGVVFLLGLIPRAKADKAVEITSRVFGVQGIVKMFEHTDA